MRAHARLWGVGKRPVLTLRVGSTEPWVVRREAEARASLSLQQLVVTAAPSLGLQPGAELLFPAARGNTPCLSKSPAHWGFEQQTCVASQGVEAGSPRSRC